ncbi:MAG: hypothetical protein E6R09_05705 [Rhodocyclaceae bacterium]|nr:MAG: hypothetical protein E6R09_05705 [Rhodocyclaceae bacterium]
MGFGPNNSSAGNRKSPPKYRVMEEQIPIKDGDGNPIPNQWKTVYFIEIVSTGKRHGKSFETFEVAILECDSLNAHSPE